MVDYDGFDGHIAVFSDNEKFLVEDFFHALKTGHRTQIQEAYNDYRTFAKTMASLEMPYRWELELLIEKEFRKAI